MRHVFVETNWVVDWAAPEHLRQPAAVDLASGAARGDFQVHLPAICVTEAFTPLRKLHPRSAADAIRKFLPWALEKSVITDAEGQTVRTFLDKLEATVRNDLTGLQQRLASIRTLPGVNVFGMDDEMLAFAVELAEHELGLKPFDQSILAAILVRAKQLSREAEHEFFFCDLDTDLQPWARDGSARRGLKSLYDRHRIWVYGDFTMTTPAPYDGWPDTLYPD